MIKNGKPPKYLFIIGQSRSGSKFYMQYLNSIPGIFIAPEAVFKYKFKKNQFQILNKVIRQNPYDYAKMVHAVINSNIKNTTNELYHSVGISDFIAHLEQLKQEIVNPYQILKLLLEFKALKHELDVVGVKFPVHSSYVRELITFFPNCYLLFITRNPGSILVSDLVKKKYRIKKGITAYPFKGLFLRPSLLFFTIIEFRTLISSYKELRTKCGVKQIILSPYKMIVENPETVKIAISEFLNYGNVNPLENNHLRILDSSFDYIQNDRTSELYWVERLLIKFFIGSLISKYTTSILE